MGQIQPQHVVGTCAVAVAAICTGTYQVPRQLDRIRKLHPPLEDAVYVFYLCCGFVMSCCLACSLLPYNQQIMHNPFVCARLVFTWWGALSGALITLAFYAAFFAIARLGLAVHAGISMGVAILTSFLWGVFINKDQLASLGINILALVLLVVGSSICACHLEVAQFFGFAPTVAPRNGFGLRTPLQLPGTVEAAEAKPLMNAGEAFGPQRQQRTRFLGLLACIASGACGGLSLGPMSFVSPEHKGVAFLPSFASGIALMTVAITLLRIATGAQQPTWHFREAFPCGLLSGALYCVATFAIIVAIPRVSFAVSCSRVTLSVVNGRNQRRAAAQKISGQRSRRHIARRRSNPFLSTSVGQHHMRYEKTVAEAAGGSGGNRNH